MITPTPESVRDAATDASPPFLRPRPITKKELCAWLECTPKFVEDEVRKGHLRMRRLSARMVRFTWPDIEAWLESKAL
jgi:hypothetical protein